MYPNMKECARQIELSGIALKTSNNPNVPLHTHKWFEIVYIVKGKTEYRLNQDSFLVQEGNYYIIDYNRRHEYHRLNDEPFQMVNVMFAPNFFDPGLFGVRHLDELLQHFLIQLEKNEFSPSPTHTIFNDLNSSILGYITNMMNEYSAQKTGYLEMMRSWLLLILIQIRRNISPPNAARNTDNRSYTIADYIRKHYREKIKIEDTFPTGHYSLSYISKLFKNDMGMTFSEYLKKVRIEESCRLLLNSNQSIAEIAEAVGYPDTTFYHNAFKELIQMSPHEYRKHYSNFPRPTVEEAVQERIDQSD